jgi:TolB-like protein
LVVDEALAQRSERLAAYTIGLEVCGRSEDFDPQTDPIVRVEAGRLRKRLERYYLAEGVDDPVLIEMPKGGYVPRFSYRVTGGTSAEPSGEGAHTVGVVPDRRRRGRRAAIAVLGLVVLVALGLGLRRFVRSGAPGEPNQSAGRGQGNIAAVVLPFDYAADSDPHPFLEDGMVEELISTLAALPGIDVVASGSGEQAAADELTLREIAEALHVDYVIRGTVRQERNVLRVTVSVVDAQDSAVQLSKGYDGRIDHVLDLQQEVARDIADALALTATPAFERRLGALGELNAEVLALYHDAAMLRDPPSDPVRSRLAEEAYRRVIELDPEFAGGYAGLAYVLAFRSWWGLSEQPEIDARQGLDAARLAVDLDPEFGWAQMSLGLALNVTGDHDEALSAARRARELSASDPYVLAFSAMLQAFAGEEDAAVPLARSAIRLDPLSVRRPFRNILGVILFHADRFQEALDALQENNRLGGPDGPHMAYYRAAALARLGRSEEARRELKKAQEFPYEFDVRDFLTGFRDPQEAHKLFDSLESVDADHELAAVRTKPADD